MTKFTTFHISYLLDLQRLMTILLNDRMCHWIDDENNIWMLIVDFRSNLYVNRGSKNECFIGDKLCDFIMCIPNNEAFNTGLKRHVHISQFIRPWYVQTQPAENVCLHRNLLTKVLWVKDFILKMFCIIFFLNRPEAMGVVTGCILLVALFLFIPVPFIFNDKPINEFPHNQVWYDVATIMLCTQWLSNILSHLTLDAGWFSSFILI